MTEPFVPRGLPMAEVLRYMGCAHETPEMLALARGCEGELLAAATPRRSFRVVTPRVGEGCVEFEDCPLVLPGRDLARLLATCDRAALLCATLGAGVDALLRRTQVEDMARGLAMEACAAAAIELLCDHVQEEILAGFPGREATMRYSPGYGDLPLTVQGDFLRALDAPRRVGLCATESSILTPRKSVTAVLGIVAKGETAKPRKRCEGCNLRGTCVFRKKEEYCGL